MITNVTTDMECYKQEIFGPVLVCQPRPWRAGALSHAHTHSREPESDPRITATYAEYSQLPTLSTRSYLRTATYAEYSQLPTLSTHVSHSYLR